VSSFPNKYKTLKQLSEGIYKEKGSKFIAYAAPCSSESEVRMLLEQWRKEHHQARHLCYAYRLGPEMNLYRANDDGEPSNSAGTPILGQIRSFELTNVLIGVVRYFGGTKLGVGGLVFAYKEAAKDALLNGSIIEKSVNQMCELHFPYSRMSEVMTVLKQNEIEVKATDFKESCTVEIKIPILKSDELIAVFKKMEELEFELKEIK
jgi:uncharacterized YigZ family protein